MKRVLITFVTLALGIASAASNVYHITLAQTAWVGGSELKPGDYKIEMNGNKAIFKSGKNSIVEVSAKIEAADRKFESTSVEIQNAGTKPMIEQIRVGGTTTKITLERGTPAVE